MAHAYLYEVGPGKDYTTIGTAHDQLVTDWGTDEFDAPVEVRIYDDTYTEAVDWNCDLNPTILNPLRIYAADGNNSVIWDADGGAYCLRMYTSGNLDWLHIKGIQFLGSTGYQLYIRYVTQVVIEDCKITDPDSAVVYTRYNSRTVFIRCELDSGSAYLVYAGNDIDFIRSKLVFGAPQALASYTTLSGCIVDGSDLLTTEDMFTYAGLRPILVRNSVFKGGKRAIVVTGTAATTVEIINTIFTGQEDGAIDLSAERFYHAVIEANDFYDQNGYFLKDADGTYSSIADIRTAGYDTLLKSLDSDPKLDNPFTGKIAADSPCIEAGIGVGVLADYWGNSSSQIYDRPSIGADFQWDSDDAPAIPGNPDWNGALTSGDTQVTLHITADEETDTVYARYRTGGDWSAENETFKRVGSGDITITGLTNDTLYRFVIYARNGAFTSDWSAPRSAVPEGGGAGTTWTPVLAKMDTSWEGIF